MSLSVGCYCTCVVSDDTTISPCYNCICRRDAGSPGNDSSVPLGSQENSKRPGTSTNTIAQRFGTRLHVVPHTYTIPPRWDPPGSCSPPRFSQSCHVRPAATRGKNTGRHRGRFTRTHSFDTLSRSIYLSVRPRRVTISPSSLFPIYLPYTFAVLFAQLSRARSNSELHFSSLQRRVERNGTSG